MAMMPTLPRRAELTLEHFLQLATRAHGTRFDYSRVLTLSAVSRVSIGCPDHGFSWQRPIWHLRNAAGCLACVKKARRPGLDFEQKEIIERCRQVHDDYFDYTATVYWGKEASMNVRCPVHGEIWVSAQRHLSGTGCRRCTNALRRAQPEDTAQPPFTKKTQEQYLADLRHAHGEKYDYSQVRYTGIHAPVTLICSSHGPFTKNAESMLKTGCRACYLAGRVPQRNNRRLQCPTETEAFIARARDIHADRFDYGSTVLTDPSQNVKILCREHGLFWQKPYLHLSGAIGCRSCAGQYANAEYRIRQARELYGDRYDYSQVQYAGYQTPVTILCAEHGPFERSMREHLTGAGCGVCALMSSLATEPDHPPEREALLLEHIHRRYGT